MARTLLPFNIKILKLEKRDLQTLREIKSLDYYENAGGQAMAGQLHEEGLFSTVIFGRVGEERRDTTFAYIDLHATILHPVIYGILTKMRAMYAGIMAGTLYAEWNDTLKDFVPTSELKGQTGYGFFLRHWKDIVFKRTGSNTRDVNLKVLETYKDSAEIDKVLVLPAGLRDIEMGDDGRPVVGEVNTFYRRLIAVSRTIVPDVSDPYHHSLDLPRLTMSMTFNECYDYFMTMLQGKRGFVQNKWGARRIANGTRNVITAMPTDVAVLGDPKSSKFTDSYAGIYQVSAAILPLTIYFLKNTYLPDVFGISEGSARLVDPKSLSSDMVPLDPATLDRWTSNEGLEKVVGMISEPERRQKPVMIKGYYLALVYNGPDGTFKVFHDINELPSHLSKKHVHPMTWIELIYLSGYSRWNKYHAFVTRYPVAGTGSTFPSTVSCKTTTPDETRVELDDRWESDPSDTSRTAYAYPKLGVTSFVESLVLPTQRLEGLGAD